MGRLQYIRTDKNGTKIYHDYTCSRCGGSGNVHTYQDGGVCYKCWGSGVGSCKIVKEYTPEYAEVLEKKRQERRDAAVAEFENHIAEHFAAIGLNAEGKCYIPVDVNHYESKDQLKSEGARFFNAFWAFQTEVENHQLVEFDMTPYIENVYNKKSPYARVLHDDYIVEDMKQDFKEIMKQVRTRKNLETVVSEYWMEEGYKFGTKSSKNPALKVNVMKTIQFETTDYSGNDSVSYIIKMQDSEGHHFTAITSGEIISKIAEKSGIQDYFNQKVQSPNIEIEVAGSVKAHKEYEGIKETMLTRCKVVG